MFFKQYKYSKKVLSIQALFALSFNKIHVLCTVFAGRGGYPDHRADDMPQLRRG
jgi:hypothetical protein